VKHAEKQLDINPPDVRRIKIKNSAVSANSAVKKSVQKGEQAMSARNLIYSGTLTASIICLVAAVWIAPTLGAEPPTAALGGTNDRFHEFDRPGDSYPSGGAVSHMLDIWKAAAPDIDIIAPDIYHQSPIIYRMILSRYHRPDNPLLVPETGRGMAFARYFFYGLADYSAIGFAVFGIDYGPGSEMGQQFSDMGANFRVIESALPVIAELQGTEKLKAAVEEDSIPGRMLYFDRYDILVRFRPPGRRPSPPTVPAGPSVPSGRVLVGQLGPDEFLIMGFDAAIDFKPPMGSESTAAQFLLVEVGLYDENGVWKPMELLNGDLTTSGLSFPPEGAMMRVKLMRY
jgi:hypothetical protein